MALPSYLRAAATGWHRVADALMQRTARARDGLSDRLAEARARARGTFARGHLHSVPKGT